MLPVTLAPMAVQAPQAVDTSALFGGQGSDAALGRLPAQIVPQTVNGSRVADDSRGGQQQRQQKEEQSHAPATVGGNFSALMFAGKGEIRLPSPFSTPFIAQLFGQFSNNGAEQDNIAAIWLDGQGQVSPGPIGFERLEQYGQVKYAPSGAKQEVSTAGTSLQEWRLQQAQVTPFRRSLRQDDAASLFNSGLMAYASTQGRTLTIAMEQARQVSIFL